jgi:hypothetical protein
MRRILTYVVLAWAATLSAGAEILVTTDGSEIEIRGPWQQKGKMVVFTLANGQLSALRAADVDFEATARRAATTTTIVAEPVAEKPAARIVITDADVAHVAPEPATPVDSGGDADADTATADGSDTADSATAPTSQVRVIAWDQEDPADGEGRLIFGTLRNDGNTFATGIKLEIAVYEDAGALAGTQSVEPVKTSLRPGESTTFRAQFREVFTVGATRMTVSSLALEVGGAEESHINELDG